MLKRVNEKYDDLQEPKRFFVFLALISPGILLTALPDFIGPDWVASAGLIYLCVLLVLRVLSKW